MRTQWRVMLKNDWMLLERTARNNGTISIKRNIFIEMIHKNLPRYHDPALRRADLSPSKTFIMLIDFIFNQFPNNRLGSHCVHRYIQLNRLYSRMTPLSQPVVKVSAYRPRYSWLRWLNNLLHYLYLSLKSCNVHIPMTKQTTTHELIPHSKMATKKLAWSHAGEDPLGRFWLLKSNENSNLTW